MPTNRTPLRRASKSQITPQVLEVYRQARALLKYANKWEEEGGRRREFLDLCSELDTLLGRKPWQTSVMDCVGEVSKPNYIADENDWETARALLDELEKA